MRCLNTETAETDEMITDPVIDDTTPTDEAATDIDHHIWQKTCVGSEGIPSSRFA